MPDVGGFGVINRQSETITRTITTDEDLKAWVDNFTDARAGYELRVQIE